MTITDTTNTVYDLITPELRTDLITRVREDSWTEMTDDQGRRGVNQVAAFLAVAANTAERATPSLRVDLFWHAFVLHTKRYAEFCDALGGFIHHVPDRNSPYRTSPAPAGRLLMECTDCGRPGQPEALPDGLCRPCRETHSGFMGGENSPHPADIADVKAHMPNLRDLLKPV